MKRNKLNILYVMPFAGISEGAEEQDLISGLRILKSISNVNTHEIRINPHDKRIVSRFNNNIFSQKLTNTDKIRYVFNLLTTLDRAQRQAYTYNNFRVVINSIKYLEIDIIVTNTISMVLFGRQSYAKHIFRSIGFEPIYVLKTVPNRLLAFFHSLSKFISIFNELSASQIWVISPRDSRFYNRISLFRIRGKIHIIPLRQFFFSEIIKSTPKSVKNLKAGFLGSTFNVLHNKKSFNFIIEMFRKNSKNLSRVNLNVYGKKIPKEFSSTPQVKICNWVNDINEIYKENDCFLVPYFLGSGMQSKVFEPLVKGRF